MWENCQPFDVGCIVRDVWGPVLETGAAVVGRNPTTGEPVPKTCGAGVCIDTTTAIGVGVVFLGLVLVVVAVK